MDQGIKRSRDHGIRGSGDPGRGRVELGIGRVRWVSDGCQMGIRGGVKLGLGLRMALRVRTRPRRSGDQAPAEGLMIYTPEIDARRVSDGCQMGAKWVSDGGQMRGLVAANVGDLAWHEPTVVQHQGLG